MKIWSALERKFKRAAGNGQPATKVGDEIDKGLGGDSSDGGTSARVFGKFLTWMNDRPQDQLIFVVATANNIKHLPPELLRKGRFEEIWYVDLPNPDERRAILSIHLGKAAALGGKESVDFQLEDIDIAVHKTEGFTGAELAEAVISSRIAAFAEETPLRLRHFLREVSETKPLSKTMAESLEGMRTWAHERARLASSPWTPPAPPAASRPIPPKPFAASDFGSFTGGDA